VPIEADTHARAGLGAKRSIAFCDSTPGLESHSAIRGRGSPIGSCVRRLPAPGGLRFGNHRRPFRHGSCTRAQSPRGRIRFLSAGGCRSCHVRGAEIVYAITHQPPRMGRKLDHVLEGP
jgi:hypothetical protein